MATIQPVPRSGLGVLNMDARVTNSAGTVTSDLFLLDKTDAANSEVRPPLIQAPEVRLPVKGGEVNTVRIRLANNSDVLAFITNNVDVSWEVLMR